MPPLIRLMLEPQQGGTYAQMLRAVRAAEEAGFDAAFRSDHLLTIGGPPQPALEAWTTLAALSRDTSRIRLGTLVTPLTFRHPAVLAREIVTVDELSGGRLEVGVGTGWFEAEHTSLGIPFPPLRERTDRLHEAVEVMTRLWTGRPVSYSGQHYRLDSAVALPRPVQDPLPLLVGGHGGRRSTQLAARFAAEYNTTSTDPAGAAETFAKARGACSEAGRDPATLHTSWMGTVLVARDEAMLRRRLERLAVWSGTPGASPDEVRGRIEAHGVVGVYEQAAEKLRAYLDAGAERVYARLWDLDDLDQFSEVVTEVLPRATA
ncbi:MAG TPA: TIGR03560 family F420-dependent LLM class oxidoreductase [Candidatus Angelobacter sp.]|jgi:F420-dependent oxidoreductase-like protein|nr:TIGR03560 family F420-dependent LLM class oxidoreductase [Candidatus Angelobacter sp.]